MQKVRHLSDQRTQTYTVPMLAIRPESGCGLTREALAAALLAGDPRLVVAQHQTADGIVFNPHMVQPGQEAIIAQRCRTVLLAGG